MMAQGQTAPYRVLLGQLLHELQIREVIVGLDRRLAGQGGDALCNVGGARIAHPDLLLNAKAWNSGLLPWRQG